ASIAKFCADRGYTFSLVSNAVAVYSGKWINVPFSGSNSQIGLVLEALALAGSYAVSSLPDVLRVERDSLPPGTTVALVTPVVTRALVDEISEIRDRGYKVMVFYAGDRGLEITLTDVPVYLTGRALEALDRHDPVLA
ncbi:MAG TPA: hypothetical protein VFA32_15365, partial [Dehalococcoidia bacterium]|nr:hypothetical protein [Dehalococcoidia bacterium]